MHYLSGIADISPQAVLNLRNGATWRDLPTIARLEIALDPNLWVREHRKKPERRGDTRAAASTLHFHRVLEHRP